MKVYIVVEEALLEPDSPVPGVVRATNVAAFSSIGKAEKELIRLQEESDEFFRYYISILPLKE